MEQRGQLIESDEVELSDLPSEVMEQIGSYLLHDKNKKNHKILRNRPDDDLQVLLFGEVKDLILYDEDNRTGHYSHVLKEYIQYVLHVKGMTTMCNQKKKVLAVIETINSYGKIKHLLKCKGSEHFVTRKC